MPDRQIRPSIHLQHIKRGDTHDQAQQAVKDKKKRWRSTANMGHPWGQQKGNNADTRVMQGGATESGNAPAGNGPRPRVLPVLALAAAWRPRHAD